MEDTAPEIVGLAVAMNLAASADVVLAIVAVERLRASKLIN
jgi:hypothetical protein